MLRVNHLTGFGKGVSAGGGGGDADVAAFIAAAGISDPTIEGALETLVTSLKADGIWAECLAIYPFVGGDATSHSYNLKNPAAFQITWNGTVTHNANGVTGNGTTGYGATGLQPSVSLTQDDTHLAIYSRTDSAGSYSEVGAQNDSLSKYVRISLRLGNTNFASDQYGSNSLAVANTDSLGFHVATRRAVNQHEAYKNGSSIVTNTNSGSGGPVTDITSEIYVLAVNDNGSAVRFSARNIAFISIGTGLTNTEVSNYTTAVETFQDALTRGVV